MSTPEPSTCTAADLLDPRIPSATLGVLATARPDLWAMILAHPNCYPALSAHIRRHLPSLGVPQQSAVPAAPIPPFARIVAACAYLAPAAASLMLICLFLPGATVRQPAAGFELRSTQASAGDSPGLALLLLATIGLLLAGILTRIPWTRVTGAAAGVLAGLLGTSASLSALFHRLRFSSEVPTEPVLLGLISLALIAACALMLLAASPAPAVEPRR
ncbi:variant leucine-rich repeat-containing protein [Microbacterium sp. GXF6406]